MARDSETESFSEEESTTLTSIEIDAEESASESKKSESTERKKKRPKGEKSDDKTACGHMLPLLFFVLLAISIFAFDRMYAFTRRPNVDGSAGIETGASGGG